MRPDLACLAVLRCSDFVASRSYCGICHNDRLRSLRNAWRHQRSGRKIMTLTKLYIINFAGASIAAWAYANGSLQNFSAHAIVFVLMSVFVYGVIASFLAASRLANATSETIDTVLIRSEHLDLVVKALFILAVIGTGYGISSAFGSVTADSMATPESSRAAGGAMLSGAGIAYGSSVVGLSLALWSMINVRIVRTAEAIRAGEL